MPARRKHVATLFLLAGAVLLTWRTRAAKDPPGPPDPATMRIEYRPGAYFPREFPLHGTVRVLTNPVVEAGQRTRIRVEYTVGDLPVETGMSIEIWKHFNSDVEDFQIADPKAPSWFGVEFTAPGVRGETAVHTNWLPDENILYFPYLPTASVSLTGGRLQAGDKVLFDLGGPQGVRMQYYQENLFNFRIAITRNRKVLGYAGDALLSVTGGPVQRLKVQAPAIVTVGETFPLEIVPEDTWGSPAKNARGLEFRINSDAVRGSEFRFDPDLLHYVARDVTALSEGVLRIPVGTADGERQGVSNPIWVERFAPRRVYYGDLHQHTYLHDGRGVFEELYLYARRVGLLDFGAITPHHMPMSVTGPQFYLDKQFPSENWPALMKATKLMNGWQGFVSLLGYEYSVPTALGGHHNIFYNADEAPTTMQLDPNNPTAPIAKMLETLQMARVPTLVIPHIGGGPPDWSHPTDPRIERLFEITSVHGVFEESFQKHLETGIRLGASASGDTHTAAMGNAYPGLFHVISSGLTGVYASGKSRNDIWQGLYERRTFATTAGTRILMDFRVNGEPMGGELPLGNTKEADITARVSATAPIVRIDLLKHDRVIYSLHPARNRGQVLRVIWGDNLYQRRAATALRSGAVSPEHGRLRLIQPVNLDQAFEHVEQTGDRITWTTAAVSNDRDGFLADLSDVEGDALLFRLDDTGTMGLLEVRIPLAQLRHDGFYAWTRTAAIPHSYLNKMGVQPAFFLECELVNTGGPLDLELHYRDAEPLHSGDYYRLRMEQLDTNKAWSSPVWIN